MRHIPCPLMVSAIVIAALTSAAYAQLAAPADPGFAAMEARENAADGKAGPRTVPGRAIPLPDTVSPQLRAAIAAPRAPIALQKLFLPKNTYLAGVLLILCLNIRNSRDCLLLQDSIRAHVEVDKKDAIFVVAFGNLTFDALF
jgi:hypothetical protein